MNKGIIYIDYDEALNIYGKMIDASDGGFEGVRDEGGIRVLVFINSAIEGIIFPFLFPYPYDGIKSI